MDSDRLPLPTSEASVASEAINQDRIDVISLLSSPLAPLMPAYVPLRLLHRVFAYLSP